MFLSFKKILGIALLGAFFLCTGRMHAAIKVHATSAEWTEMIKALETGKIKTVKKLLETGHFNLAGAKSRGGFTLVQIAEHHKHYHTAAAIKKYYAGQAEKIKNFMEENKKKHLIAKAGTADWGDMLQAINGADFKTVKKLFKKFGSSLAVTTSGRTLFKIAAYNYEMRSKSLPKKTKSVKSKKKKKIKKAQPQEALDDSWVVVDYPKQKQSPKGKKHQILTSASAPVTRVTASALGKITASKNPILFYVNGQPFYEFANFYEASFTDKQGRVWPTSEHYFQAKKLLNPKKQEKIRKLTNPRDAFKYANSTDGQWKNDIRVDWRQVCDQTMMDALRMKFNQNPALKKLLIATYPCDLVEASPYDAYWGWGPKKDGKNMLGKMLMKLRDEFIDGNG